MAHALVSNLVEDCTVLLRPATTKRTVNKTGLSYGSYPRARATSVKFISTLINVGAAHATVAAALSKTTLVVRG